MEALFGPTLQGKSGQVPTASLASVDFVLVYFSAHWCPPCRGFTPKLAAFYQDVNATAKNVEVIFVSFDRDQGSFQGYFNEMPWLAVNYSEASKREQLGSQFNVSGIPKLVLLRKNGTVGNDNCRGDVESAGPRALERWRSML